MVAAGCGQQCRSRLGPAFRPPSGPDFRAPPRAQTCPMRERAAPSGGQAGSQVRVWSSRRVLAPDHGARVGRAAEALRRLRRGPRRAKARPARHGHAPQRPPTVTPFTHSRHQRPAPRRASHHGVRSSRARGVTRRPPAMACQRAACPRVDVGQHRARRLSATSKTQPGRPAREAEAVCSRPKGSPSRSSADRQPSGRGRHRGIAQR